MVLHSVKQQIVRMLYPYDSVGTIRRGPLKGMKCKIAVGMGFTYIWGMHQEQWTEIANLVPVGGVVYDVGANCGQSTLHFAHRVGPRGAVIAFEPIPDNFARLDQNIKMNQLTWVTTNCVAVGKEPGRATFQFDAEQPTQAGFAHVKRENPKARSVEVEVLRLDDYQSKGWPAPTFLKIDVEGGAHEVLAGAQQLIGTYRPLILFEMHNAYEQRAAKELMDVHGYLAWDHLGKPVSDPTSELIPVLLLKPKPTN